MHITSKSALITGVTGQDGAYLAKFLLDKGYRVFGTYRRLSTPNFWRLQYLEVFDKITVLPADLIDAGSITEAVLKARPDEIYHLAAQSFVGASFEQPICTAEVSGLAVLRILEAIRHVNHRVRFYFASTSELFGNGNQDCQDESSPFCPSSPYAAAKLFGHWISKIYREGYGIFTCNGILFNHESGLRGLEFVTRKISNAVAKIALGLDDKLFLGSLYPKRDWGYAPEYVEAMWLMLQKDEPDDYVIGTNESHSVEEFVRQAFSLVDLDWEKYVVTEPSLFRVVDVDYLKADYSKAQEKLGWQPKTSFAQLVEKMVKEDLERWQRWLRGDRFPWDAPNHPNEMNVLRRSRRDR